MNYKEFSAYHNIKLKFGEEGSIRYGYLAQPLQPQDERDGFSDNLYLIYRLNEYSAQVELACAKIFQLLMGYGPEMTMVKNDGDFFIASREYSNFTEGFPSVEAPYATIRGYAAIFVLSYFLADSDLHAGNIGFQQLKNGVSRAVRLDLADAMDRETLQLPVTLDALRKIPYCIEGEYRGVDCSQLALAEVSSDAFQREKKAMIDLIAKTDFNVFKQILEETITAELVTDFSIEEYVSIDTPDHVVNPSLKKLITLFAQRHKQWREVVVANSFEQDYSLSSPEEYQKKIAELNQGNESDYSSSESSYSESGHVISDSESDFSDSESDDGNVKKFNCSTAIDLKFFRKRSPTPDNDFPGKRARINGSF